eukprot:tig00020610_g12048.t1
MAAPTTASTSPAATETQYVKLPGSDVSIPVTVYKGSESDEDPAFKVQIFGDKNYEGATAIAGPGQTKLPYPFAGDVESLIVPTGMKATLYQNSDCTGVRQEFGEGSHPSAGHNGKLMPLCIRVSPFVKVDAAAGTKLLDVGHHELEGACGVPPINRIDVPKGREALVQQCEKHYSLAAGSFRNVEEAFGVRKVCVDVLDTGDAKPDSLDPNKCPHALTDPAIKCFNSSLIIPDGYLVTMFTRPDCTGYSAQYVPGCKSSTSGDLFTQAQCIMVDKLNGAPLPTFGGGGFPGSANYLSTAKAVGISLAEAQSIGNTGEILVKADESALDVTGEWKDAEKPRVEASEEQEQEPLPAAESSYEAGAAAAAAAAGDGGDAGYVYVEDVSEEMMAALAGGTGAEAGGHASSDWMDDLASE